jgi:hypothetical protein
MWHAKESKYIDPSPDCHMTKQITFQTQDQELPRSRALAKTHLPLAKRTKEETTKLQISIERPKALIQIPPIQSYDSDLYKK